MAPKPVPAERRFWPRVDKDGPVPSLCPDLGACWLWLGAKRGGGYGVIADRRSGKVIMLNTHRLAYELVIGPIPSGMQLDHLCHVRHCVNPRHLQPMTQRINNLRCDGPFARKWRQSHCLNGHPFDEANTRVNRNGTRHCKACRDDRRRQKSELLCACGCGARTTVGARWLKGHTLTRSGRIARRAA